MSFRIKDIAWTAVLLTSLAANAALLRKGPISFEAPGERKNVTAEEASGTSVPADSESPTQTKENTGAAASAEEPSERIRLPYATIKRTLHLPDERISREGLILNRYLWEALRVTPGERDRLDRETRKFVAAINRSESDRAVLTKGEDGDFFLLHPDPDTGKRITGFQSAIVSILGESRSRILFDILASDPYFMPQPEMIEVSIEDGDGAFFYRESGRDPLPVTSFTIADARYGHLFDAEAWRTHIRSKALENTSESPTPHQEKSFFDSGPASLLDFSPESEADGPLGIE